MYKIQQKSIFKVNRQAVDIDLSIENNRINLLLGNNGVGKSTFFDFLKNNQVLDAKLVFMDQVALNPLLPYKCKDVIKILKEEISDLRSDQSINETFNFDITDLLEKNVSYLSGGEQQRFKLYLSLLQVGDIYLIDEPFSFLDESNKEIFLNTFQRLLELGKYVFIIEHDISIFNNWSKNIIDMFKKGDKIVIRNRII